MRARPDLFASLRSCARCAPALLVAALILVAFATATATTTPRAAQAQEDPTPAPTATPAPAWGMATLYGGPIRDLAVVPDTRPDAQDTQRIWGTGNGIFVSTRGITWTMAPRDFPDSQQVVAASAETAFVTDSEGVGRRTFNGGRSWSVMRVGDQTPYHIAAVSPDFDQEQQAYAIFEADGRLWRTSDSGSRWTEVVIARGAQPMVGAVGFSPLFPTDETVFAGTNAGFHVSTNAGQEWSEGRGVGAGGPVFGPSQGPVQHQGILVPAEFGDDPARKIDPEVEDVFAWTPAGLWVTPDQGMSWRSFGLPAGLAAIHDVAVSEGWPADPVIVVAGRPSTAGGAIGAISEDGGDSWRPIAGASGLEGTAVVLAVDFWHRPGPDRKPPRQSPTLTEHIFLPNVYSGFDFTGDPEADPPVPSDFVHVTPIVLRREITIGTNGAGVWSSADLGRTWDRTSALPGLRNARPSTVTFLDDESALVGSQRSGLFRSEDAGASWTRVESALPRGERGAILALGVSPAYASDRTVFAATADGLWVSRDGGTAWTATSGPAGARYVAFSPDFAQDGRMMAGGHRSSDRGASWQALPGAEDWDLRAAAFSPRFANDSLILAGGYLTAEPDEGTGVLVSRDGGDTWAAISHNQVRDRPVLAIAAIAVDPSEDLRIAVGTTNGMFASEDGGADWRRVPRMSARDIGSLEGAVRREPSLTGIFVAATGDGAYWSFNRGMDYLREPRSPRPLDRVALSPGALRVIGTMPLGITYAELAVLEAGDAP